MMGFLKGIGKKVLKTLLESDRISVVLVGVLEDGSVRNRDNLAEINVSRVRRIVAQMTEEGLGSEIVITIDDKETRIEL